MEKQFHNPLQFEAWVNKALHMDDNAGMYDGNQILAGEICVLCQSLMYRERLKRAILDIFLPVLPSIRYCTFDSFEPSKLVSADLSYYSRDMLAEDILAGKGTQVTVTFLDLSKEMVIKSLLLIQDCHRKELVLDHLYKTMVLNYLAEQPGPIEYAVSAHHMRLVDTVSGKTVDVECEDTSAYVRLYHEWNRMKSEIARSLGRQQA